MCQIWKRKCNPHGGTTTSVVVPLLLTQGGLHPDKARETSVQHVTPPKTMCALTFRVALCLAALVGPASCPVSILQACRVLRRAPAARVVRQRTGGAAVA